MTPMTETEETIRRVGQLLADARNVLFITGAGISADSGLPTYRGVGGLYEGGITEEGFAVEEVLSGAMMRARPEITWRKIREIEQACRGASPNRGHRVIAEVEAALPRVVTLTQNVDALHQEAGAREVIDLHGDVRTLFCPECGWRERVKDYAHLDEVPRCPECDAVIRPDVVLFGEMLPDDRLLRMRTELKRGFDLVFVIGTSSGFPYIADPVVTAARRGTPTVEINPAMTEVSHFVAHRLPMRAAEALHLLWVEARVRRLI
ncbi:MAG: SIR2 family NAD-dependent protein deacylase [Myxococcota bacterium]